jgi:hypothetical protein
MARTSEGLLHVVATKGIYLCSVCGLGQLAKEADTADDGASQWSNLI